MSFCWKCGFQVSEGSVYCGKCGTNLSLPLQAPNNNTASALDFTPKRNWFERHLNWTWVLGLVAFYFLQIVIGFIWGVVRGASSTPIYQTELDSLNLWGWVAAFLVVYLPITGYVLKKKGRSLWFLLISTFFFLPLWIENKNKI